MLIRADFDVRYGEHAISTAARVPTRNGDAIQEVVIGAWECPVCAALITDIDRHRDWHNHAS